jgi:hypothetical protein
VVENNRKRTHGFLLNGNFKAVTVFRQMIDEAMQKIKHGQLLINEKKTFLKIKILKKVLKCQQMKLPLCKVFK